MEEINLPEDLYVDYREYSGSTSAPPNTTRPPQSFSAADLAEIQRLINLLDNEQTRAEAITRLNRVWELNKEKGPELALLLWNSKDKTFSLLEELTSAYSLLSPPQLGMAEATRVCDALALIQCMATHPDAKLELIKGQIPKYIYAFLNTTEPRQQVQYENLRLSGLCVIGALLMEECPETVEIVHYLLEGEMVPLSLRCMDLGSDLTKSVATHVLSKILRQEKGQAYCGSRERFFAVSDALTKVVDKFFENPPAALISNTLSCYLRLSEISMSVGYCEELKKRFPLRLKDSKYLNRVCDGDTRALAKMVRQIIMGVQGQVQPVPVRNPVSGMRPTQM